MPNIIVSLIQEMRRVRELIPLVDVSLNHEASRIIHFAEDNMARNDLEGMKESLDDLSAFTGKAKK